ncbi:MAG: hypothetical protein K2Y32_11685 [Candidatus Obscuribacterales bacterium]|nr:hypothetical protein [Candidatus Obscuribacterales bacterium]
MTDRTAKFLVLTAACLLVSTGEAAAQSETAKKSDYRELQSQFRIQAKPSPERFLKFPDVDLGILVVTENKFVISEAGKAGSKSKTLLARGNVKIPADCFVTFCPNGNFYKDPKRISCLPENSFDGVLFRFIAMEDEEFGRGDRGLQAMGRFKNLRLADLDRAEISENSLSALRNCRELEVLHLFATDAKGRFLKEMLPCQSLKVLDLAYTSLDKDYLQYIPRYPKLYKLNLSRTGLDAASLTPLKDCKSLIFLDLSSNPAIKDDIIPVALSIKQLKFLNLDKTNVTNKALKTLQQKGIITSKAELYASDPKQLKKMEARKKNRYSDAETLFGPVSRGRKL